MRKSAAKNIHMETLLAVVNPVNEAVKSGLIRLLWSEYNGHRCNFEGITNDGVNAFDSWHQTRRGVAGTASRPPVRHSEQSAQSPAFSGVCGGTIFCWKDRADQGIQHCRPGTASTRAVRPPIGHHCACDRAYVEEEAGAVLRLGRRRS